MKHILILALAFFCLTATAQNQVVRRQGAKKETSASTPKKTNNATTSKKSATSKKTASPKKTTTSKRTTPIAKKTTASTQQQPQPHHTFNASYSNGVLTVNGVRYEMMMVYAGTFTMGATSEMQNPYRDEKPAHQVTLTNNYRMGKTEVTQALWTAVMGSNPSHFKGDNKPVECVSWNDCQEFISKLNAATGKNFRLPTEAEWEYAARGGNNSRHYQYSGSNTLNDVGWYTDNSSNTTHEVATKRPNELGLYDMSGNVWEWCSDWYGSYSSNTQYDPAGPTSGSSRVSRGGCWYYYAGWGGHASYCRSSFRVGDTPDNWFNYYGLRLALSETASTQQQPRNTISYSNGVLAYKGITYEMVKVEAGTFTMGATSEMQNPNKDEKPAHQVTLTNNYYLGKTEVTQALWTAVMGSNPSRFKGDNKPVESVSWNDCQEFISRLNAATGKHFRLPTEAEWEFAARGGNNSKHHQYSGSYSQFDVAWFSDNSGNATHDVATKQPNELGLYDMSGNVWEWCNDLFGKYPKKPQTNPTGPSSGSNRVDRGGSWSSYARNCRSSYRSYDAPDDRYYNLGLRLALSE